MGRDILQKAVSKGTLGGGWPGFPWWKGKCKLVLICMTLSLSLSLSFQVLFLRIPESDDELSTNPRLLTVLK